MTDPTSGVDSVQISTSAGRVSMERRTFEAGFDFARRLADPMFRAALTRLTDSSSNHAVMATGQESISHVMDRLVKDGITGRAVIAVPDPDHDLGFRLLGVVIDAESLT